MLPMSLIFFCLVLFPPYSVRGTLTPRGTVSVDCGSSKTFTCDLTGITGNPNVGWNINNLVNITASDLNGFLTAGINDRISTTAINGTSTPTSTITIADFTMSDNNGAVRCINVVDGSVQGMATVSVEPLPPPSNATATTVGHDCTVITLQWDKPDTPPDITSAVSCTPSSTSCGACTSSPCDITGLTLNTDYTFTVTLNSGMCGTSMATTTARTLDVPSQLMNVVAQLINDTSVQITWDVPSTSPPVTSVTVNCTPPSPNCGTCPPSGPCTISGLDCNTTCNFTVTPENNCGNGSASSVSATKSSTAPPPPTTPPPGLPIVTIVVPTVAAIILVVLGVIIVIVVVIWCVKKKHGVKACPCLKKKEKENGGEGDVIYEDPEKNNDNIKMQSSPAYQTVSSVCGTKDDYYYPGLTDDVKMEPSPAYQTVS